MKNFIYITTNLINEKQYIGFHNGTEDDDYLGSGKYLLRAVKKYGKENFRRKIIEECNLKDSLLLETYYIKNYDTLTPKGYNISPTGGHRIGGKLNNSTKEKIRKSLKGIKHSEERKKKISEAGKGRKYSKERCEKQRQSMLGKNKGKKMSNEAKQKISLAQIGKKHSEETKQKMSESHKGKLKGFKHSEEFKERIRKRQTGKKFSEETKKKQSEALKKYWKNKKIKD